MKHTPGPWNIVHSGYANTPFVIWAGPTEPNLLSKPPLLLGWIAEVCGDKYGGTGADDLHVESAANASLIAAAPELLKSLRQLTDCVKYWADHGRAAEIDHSFVDAIAAIAKAEGKYNEIQG